MTSPIILEAAEPVSRRARLVLAILATLVLLTFTGVVEVGVLAVVAVVSAGRLVHLTDASRLIQPSAVLRQTVAMA